MMDSAKEPMAARRAQNYCPLVLALAAVCAGIVVDRLAPPSEVVWSLVCLSSLAAWLGLWLKGWQRAAFIALSLAMAAAGGAWHHLHWYGFDADDLAELVGEEPQPVAVRAIALAEPRHIPAPAYDPLRGGMPASDYSRLEVRVTAVRDGTRWRRATGLANLSVSGRLKGVYAGDALQVFAKAAKIVPPKNPGAMDFAAHQRADGIRCRLWAKFPECLTVVESGSPWSLSRGLDSLRRHGNRLLRSHLDQDRSGFAAALLLGAREKLGYQRKKAFIHTNTIHFLAISGLHVGILAGSLFLALRWGLLPRKAALIFVAFASTVYVLLTGSPPSAVRALILVLLVCLSMGAHRPTHPFNCLAAAGLFILALNPADLFRTGPQLSFLAVGMLAWFCPRLLRLREQDALQRLVAETRPWPIRSLRWIGRWFWRATAVTAVVWLATLPLIMAQFHLVAPVAIVVSPFLWLPIAVTLMSGFGVLAFGWLIPPLGAVFGWICDGSLWLVDSLVASASAIPGGHFWVSGPETWWLIGFYGGVGIWAAFPRWRPRRRWSLALLSAWIAAGLAHAWFESQPADRLQCTFLSMGHGCCVVLELPDGRTMLYDAGHLGSPAGGTRSVAEFLWWRGITHIDAVILSHGHVDHYNALPGLLRQIRVDKAYVSRFMFQGEEDGKLSPAPAKLWDALAEAGVKVREISDGVQLTEGGGCVLRALHPPQGKGWDGSAGINANSLVIAVEYHGRRILLPGDLEKEGLERMMAQPAYDCDVLLAPHHGSVNSDPVGFAAWSTPEWVVISSGYGGGMNIVRKYGAAGTRTLHTARDGAVKVCVESDGLSVYCWDRNAWRPAPVPLPQ